MSLPRTITKPAQNRVARSRKASSLAESRPARDEAARDRVQAALRGNGVPTAIYYPRPLHRQPAYSAQHDGSALPVSEDLAQRILALPIHPDLGEADAAHVCDRVLAALG